MVSPARRDSNHTFEANLSGVLATLRSATSVSPFLSLQIFQPEVLNATPSCVSFHSAVVRLLAPLSRPILADRHSRVRQPERSCGQPSEQSHLCRLDQFH